MKNLDLKYFTINQLKGLSKDIQIRVEDLPSKFTPLAGDFWTVSEFTQFKVEKGSENIYLEFDIYSQNQNEERSAKIFIYSKEDHNTIKQLINKLTQTL